MITDREPGWQLIGTAPMDGSHVWLAADNDAKVGYWAGDMWRDFASMETQGQTLGFVPTHWRPIGDAIMQHLVTEAVDASSGSAAASADEVAVEAHPEVMPEAPRSAPDEDELEGEQPLPSFFRAEPTARKKLKPGPKPKYREAKRTGRPKGSGKHR
jgi:hypothetical protein